MRRIIEGIRLVSLFVTLLFSIAACAQQPTASTDKNVTSAEVLQPYLGKWRPTSAAEARNVEAFTIAVDELSEEPSGAFVKYEVERRVGAAVIVRVTSTGPGDGFFGPWGARIW